jgi:TRAP-type transport system periplasmic protein
MFNRRTLCAAAAAACLAAAPTFANTTLTVSNWVPAGHPVAVAVTKWTQDVEKATAGRVKFQTLPKAVATPQAHYNAIRDGLADVSFTVLGYTPGRFGLSEVSELPLMGTSAESNSVALQRIAQKYPPFMGEYKDVKVLALFTHGPGIVFNGKKPVQSLDDFKGLKFRVGGGVVNEVGKLIEANTTLKPATESYELLSTGVMDGVFLPFESISTYKIDKLIRHATVFPGGLYNSAFLVMMNRKAYDSLPAADREALDKLSGEPFSRALGKSFDDKDKEGAQLAQASGIKVVQASPEFVKAVESRVNVLEKTWIESAKGKGLANADQVLKEFRAEARK